MQHLILILLLFFSSILFAQSKSNSEKSTGRSITITAVNVLTDNGEIKFAFYNEENFRKQPLYTKSASIENGKSTVVFENVPLGIYSVVCYHDENDNKRLDFYESGVPKESYGTSNNALKFGPPKFENSKFEVNDTNLILEIKL